MIGQELYSSRLEGGAKLSQPVRQAGWMWMAIVVLIGIVVAAMVFPYVKKETVRGFVVSDKGIISVAAPVEGRVVSVTAREGLEVNKGDILAVLTSENTARDGKVTAAAHVGEIDNQAIALNRARRALVVSAGEKAETLRSQLASAIFSRDTAQKQLVNRSEIARISAQQLQGYEKLRSEGWSSQMQVDQKRQETLALKGEIMDLEVQIRSLNTSIDELKRQLANASTINTSEIAAIDTQLSGLSQQKIDYGLQEVMEIRAPVAGRVTTQNAEPGQYVQRGSQIFTVVPVNAKTEIELLVPSRVIGSVAVGDEVRLKIDAYAVQKYGYLKGKVVSISGATIRGTAIAPPVVAQEAVYRVRVKPTNTVVRSQGRERNLQIDMALSADIITERKPVWRRIFDPFIERESR